MKVARGELDEPCSDLVDEYEAWLRSWASERTTTARVNVAAGRLAEWGLDGITRENIQTFLAGPQPGSGRKPWKKWTKATYHGHLTDWCKWLVATGYLDASPMEDVRSVKRPRPSPRPLTEQQVDAVLSVIQGETRDQFLLAIHAGLRVSEIARIRGEHVAEDGIQVMGKGESEDTLPCHPDIWEMAQRYPRFGYWFPGSDGGHVNSQQISLTVSRLFRSMGIAGSIHRGRHYYATSLLRAGVNVRDVQRLMRHANLETTASYAAVDEDNLRSAINLLPSRLSA